MLCRRFVVALYTLYIVCVCVYMCVCVLVHEYPQVLCKICERVCVSAVKLHSNVIHLCVRPHVNACTSNAITILCKTIRLALDFPRTQRLLCIFPTLISPALKKRARRGGTNFSKT